MKQEKIKALCPCCGCFTLEEGGGNYEICPVCFWEDDPVQNKYPDMAGGANEVSLFQARENYRMYGVAQQRFAAHVRKPTEEEMPYESEKEFQSEDFGATDTADYQEE